jgi:hypothetical protein
MYNNFQANPNRFDHSNMAKITASSDFIIKDRFQSLELYFIKCESILKSTCLNTFTRHKSIQSTYSKSSHKFIQHKSIQTWLLSNLSIQTSHSKQHCKFIQFNQLICTKMKWSTRDIPWLGHDDYPISKLQLIFCKPSNNSNKSPQLEL